jgi:excisionase family DNA binding protein
MAHKDDGLNLTAAELARCFSDPVWSARFPPILGVDQVAQLLQVSKATVYDWSSRGLLKGCCSRVGKHLRFFRDRLLLRVFNEGLDSHGK